MMLLKNILLIEGVTAALALRSLNSSQFYEILGVQDGVDSRTRARPLRLNIEDIQKDPYAWPLFLQALNGVQNSAVDYPMSYFQMCGIHGRPYIAWNNVHGQVDYSTGYCTHDSILFPIWHRPYLALFEQEINTYAQAISFQYQDNAAQWQAAARNLRLPYWDWATSSDIPYIVNQPTVDILTSSGRKPNYRNPLYTYNFPPMDQNLFPEDLARTGNTVRDENANQALSALGLRAATYNALTHISGFPSFATTAVSGSSLESVHSMVHVGVGGRAGHMTYLSYAAFDPIFWLHHSNCDRIFALFQAAKPGEYFPAEGYSDHTYTFTQGPQLDHISTPLAPFTSSSDGTMWTPDTSRSMSAFGYSYPEIDDWNQDPNQLAQNVTAQINRLYGTSSTKSAHKARQFPPPSNQWFVDVSVNKYEMNEQFIVWVFLGDPPADSGSWKYSTNLIGSLVVFTPPEVMQGKVVSTTYGEIALQNALSRAGLPNLDDRTVIEHLKKNLQWKLQKINGTPIDVAKCRSLNVSVYDEKVTPLEDEYHFPTYGARTAHPEATKGKTGGY